MIAASITGLDAEVSSFHTERYRKNFARSCGRLLDDVAVRGRNLELADGRIVWTVAHPISIDVDEFTASLQDTDVVRALDRLETQFQGRRMLLGVDRLDYTKGIPERLLASSGLWSVARTCA